MTVTPFYDARSLDVEETSRGTPTCALRWKAAKLEQLWTVTTYRGGVAISRCEEWRDVPTAEDD